MRKITIDHNIMNGHSLWEEEEEEEVVEEEEG